MLVGLLVTLHVIVSLFLVGVVLLQQGKSADLAGAFGGQGSQTAFGPRGAANLLTKLTTYSAIIFMLTSIGLTILLSRASGDHSVLSGTPTTQSTPAKKYHPQFTKMRRPSACAFFLPHTFEQNQPLLYRL